MRNPLRATLVALALLIASAAYAERAEPFGLTSAQTTNRQLVAKWETMLAMMAIESKLLSVCQQTSSCSPVQARFIQLAAIVKQSESGKGIRLLNGAVRDAIGNEYDPKYVGKQLDVWSSPLATLEKRKGDCEDYVFLKYALLRAAGVPASKLRPIIVRDIRQAADHAVLAVYDDEQWLILDNTTRIVAKDTDLAGTVYLPLFALGEGGVQEYMQSTARK